jgi:hypothetical protein
LPLHFLPTGCQGTEKHDPGKQTPNQFLVHLYQFIRLATPAAFTTGDTATRGREVGMPSGVVLRLLWETRSKTSKVAFTQQVTLWQ